MRFWESSEQWQGGGIAKERTRETANETRQSKREATMLRTVLLGFLLVLPLKTHEFQIHEVVKRDAKHHSLWNYEDKTGPNNWPMMFKKCGSDRQSPIDIDPDDLDVNQNLGKFDFENYEDELEDAKIENNGHTIQITPGIKDEIYFTKGGLDDKYKFLQLHFHWGSDSKQGSEHTIDGERFPMEMHLVHMNMNYKTMERAQRKEDGLAVLAVLFEVSDADNPALEPIIEKLDDVRKEGAKVDIDGLTLKSILPDDLMPYYRYAGSLTTPPCLEIVVWTIFKDRVPISEKQLQLFRNVKEEDEHEPEENLVNNYRPVQPLYERKVEISGEDDDDDDNNGSILAPSILLILFAISFFF